MNKKVSEIAQGLKDLRLEKGYTQEYVAGLLGAEHPSSVYRLENGLSNLKLEDAAKLAELYDITLDEIYHPEKRSKDRNMVNDHDRASYGNSNQLQISVLLDGNPVRLQKQIDMLTKVNAALAGS